MNLPGVMTGLAVLGLQLLVFSALPLLWRIRRDPGRKVCLEEFWILLLLCTATQALLGSLWSHLRAPFPPAAEALAYALAAVGVAECLCRFPLAVRPLQSRIWMTILITLTLLARVLPAAEQSSLGQSDAYSHLQFGMEIIATGQLSHPVYPVGHSWVQVLPALLFRPELYLLYRYGGAFYGLNLVLGIFFVSRRSFSERAALCAALLAAGSPLMLPLIRTGVGVYANQFGLMLIPALLWTLPRRFTLTLPLLTALALSVPMMVLDLLPVFLLYYLFRKRFLHLSLLLLIGGGGAGLIFWKLQQLPPEHLQATFTLLSGGRIIHDLPGLLLHYLQPKTVEISPALRAGVGLLALVSGTLLAWPACRKPGRLLPLLLCSFCGFQSVSGCFQFAGYQRAGWLFLIGLAMVSGVTGWYAARRCRLETPLRPLLALSCVGLYWFPPLHQPHLSGAENELVDFLRRLPRTRTGEIWSRPFNNFAGGQGDPLRVLLRDSSDLRVHQLQAGKNPDFPQHLPVLVVVDQVPPPLTPHAEHNRQIRELWSRNRLLEDAVRGLPAERVRLLQQGPLLVWEISPGRVPNSPK